MDSEERNQVLNDLIDRPQDREQILSDARLSEEDRRVLARLVETADSLWFSAQRAPALEQDPVAAMLGLVPDDECRLDRAALTRARKAARLSVSDLAAGLRQRGWEFDNGDVFRWETRSAADVPPAVVQAIADLLGTPLGNLISSSSSTPVPDVIAAVRKNPLFEQLVDRWARARHVSHAVAAAALETRALATVHRGEHPDQEQLLNSLDALVAAVERTPE